MIIKIVELILHNIALFNEVNLSKYFLIGSAKEITEPFLRFIWFNAGIIIY